MKRTTYLAFVLLVLGTMALTQIPFGKRIQADPLEPEHIAVLTDLA